MRIWNSIVFIIFFTSCNSFKTPIDFVGKYEGKWKKWNSYSLELKSDSTYYFKMYSKPFFPYSDGKWSFENGKIYLTSKMDSMLIEDEKMMKLGLAFRRSDIHYFDFQNEEIKIRNKKLILTPDSSFDLNSQRIIFKKVKN